MSELLPNVSDSELIRMAAQAEQGHLEGSEALIRQELYRRQQERLASFALSNGVYDANDGTPGPVEHEDSVWPFNHDIQVSED